MNPSRSTALLLLTLAPLLPACGYFPGTTACTEEARASVVVTVVDEGGNPVPDARVTYVRDSDAELQADCMPAAGNADLSRCQSWTAGWEKSGQFTIKATSADGLRHAEQQLSVGADECHVETQQVQLTLR